MTSLIGNGQLPTRYSRQALITVEKGISGDRAAKFISKSSINSFK